MATTIGVVGQLQDQSTSWGRAGTIFAAYALVVGTASVALYFPDALGGESAAIGRATLGVLGTIAGLLIWTGASREVLGWRLALLWAVCQIPVIAWNEYGNTTLQLVEIPFKLTQRTTYNGVVTSYSEMGVNLLAIILAGIYASQQGKAADRNR